MNIRSLAVMAIIAILAAACSSDDAGDTTTTADAATTTTAVATTTTVPTTTTTAAATTTTTMAETTTTTEAPGGAVIEASPIVAALQPYNEQGATLFPVGSVQAHWYQWNGLYVVLYRGFDAADGSQICAGNSIQEAAGFNFISNSPHNGSIDEICDGAPRIAEAPSGVFACGPLLYYVTEIPTESVGNLFGTLEIVQDGGSVVYGQTSAVTGNIDVTPEFEPGLSAYELPASTVDDLGVVNCG